MALSSYAAMRHRVKTRLDRSFNASFLITSLSSLIGAIAGALVMSQVGDPDNWLTGSAIGAAALLGAWMTRRVVSIAYRRE